MTGNEHSHPHAHVHHRSAREVLLFATKRVSRRQWWIAGAAVVGVVAAVAWILLFTRFDWHAALDFVAALRPVPLIVAMSLLPLIGFPILPVYLAAGVRFGALLGGVVVTLATVVHLLGSYLLFRTILRRPIERWLARWHAHLPHIPRDEEAAIALIIALVPGLPYVARNYLLAATGIRLSMYFWVCLPIHVAKSYVSILLGDVGADADVGRLVVIGSIELTKLAIVAGVIWWLRRHHLRLHGHDPDGVLSP